MRIEAQPWIAARLAMRSVVEQDGEWRVDFHGQDVGAFGSKAEAMKAYRKAAFDKFGEVAHLPTDEDIDQTLARGDIAVPLGPPTPPPAAAQGAPGAAKPPEAPKTPPEAPKPVSGPPRPAERHVGRQPPHKGKR